MKIFIDHEKIKNAPYEDYSNEQDEQLLEQLKEQLLNENHSCYLMSGYRGVGKTSLICKVEKRLEDEKNKVRADRKKAGQRGEPLPEIIFVHINFFKYTSYTFILRNIIREMYLKLSSDQEIFKKIDKTTARNLKLLYERTFTDIRNNSGKKLVSSIDTSILFGSNLKRIILAFSVIIMGILNYFMKLIPLPPGLVSMITGFGGVLWASMETISLTDKIAKSKSEFQETIRQSLYDDEIAEYHIIKILSGLKQQYKIVFAIDELDKLESHEIEEIIYQLKPIILSDMASFVIVSGQLFLYKLSNSYMADAFSLSSIFSRLVHVPLLSNDSFRAIFKGLVLQYEDLTPDLQEVFVDSLILNSNRTIRRFLNLICQDINWEDNKAYLIVNRGDKEKYKTDSILLGMISRIYSENIEKYKYSQGINDFFIMQLHLWIQKIKLKRGLLFCEEDIFNIKKEDSSYYPYWSAAQLKNLCKVLLDNMVENALLEMNDTNQTVYYQWISGVKVKIDNTFMNTEQVRTQLLRNTIDLEKHLREIFCFLYPGSEENMLQNTKFIIDELHSKNILDDSWKHENTIKLITLSSKLNQGEAINEEDFNFVQGLLFELRKLLVKLIEGYSLYLVKHYLEERRYSYEINYMSKGTYSGRFVVKGINKNKDILFDVKYKNSISSNDNNIIKLLIKTLKKLNNENGKNNALVILWYYENNLEHYETLHNSFNSTVSMDYAELKDDIYFLILPDDKLISSNIKIKECIETILYN